MIPLPLGQVGDIELLIRARHGLIDLEAADPQRAAALFEYVADRRRLRTSPGHARDWARERAVPAD